ncbi:MAG: MBL fold metallo-hydrolase [Andreesenia angusta]|nr:MBL fold metallo-hydrolase [Andreesenia angusta]
MFLERKPLGVYAANSYIIADEESKEAVVIDPGGEPEDIERVLDDKGFNLKYIILTHGHGDHIGGIQRIYDRYNPKVLIHKDDAELLEDSEKNLTTMMPVKPMIFKNYSIIEEGDIIEFGNKEIKVIHTPGHTRGCICLLVDDKLFTGDTLFKGSIGRTDLYGGGDDLMDSIRDKILPLDDNIIVLPGHGAVSTIGDEKRINPFMQRLINERI